MVVTRDWTEPGSILRGRTVEVLSSASEPPAGPVPSRVEHAVVFRAHRAEIGDAAAGGPAQVVRFEEG